MNYHVITPQEYELFCKLKTIWFHQRPQQTNKFFICGELGHKDAVGLPDKILVCPGWGSDGFAVYTKTTAYTQPEY